MVVIILVRLGTTLVDKEGENNMTNQRRFAKKWHLLRVPARLGIALVLVLLTALPISAQAPTATTGVATGTSSTGATLNGTVNANGFSTTVTFEYGVDTSYGSTWTADQSPVTGSTNTAVSATIAELSPNTLYHYRVVATNTHGTTNGADMIFTTLDFPPGVVTTAATGIGADTATLNGIVGAYGYSTTVDFEYGTDTSYGTTVTADQSPVSSDLPVSVSKTITGLANNTTYHYRVVATNVNGTSYGNDMTFTIGTTGTAPTATTDDATFSLVPNTATLNGTVNANNSNTTVTFEYGTTTAYGTTVTADQSPVNGASDTAVSKFIAGLTPDTTYHYRVVATNATGTTNGADVTFFNTIAPYARTDAASGIGTTTATLNGTVNPKTFGEPVDTTVTFEYGLTAAYGSVGTALESPVGGPANVGVSLGLTGLTPNTTYHYRVVANNANGTGIGADMTFTTSSKPTATTDTAAPVGSTTATLNGTVNANNDSTTVTFQYGTTTAYGTTVTAAQSPVTGSTDTPVSRAITGLINSFTYHYRVVATNAGGTTYGADMTFTTGVSPPTATTNAASAIGTTTAMLNGTVNANNNSTTVTFEYGFTTAYDRSVGATPDTVTGSSNTAVNASLSALLPGTTYHYRVVAVNAGGVIYGADMTFTTLVPPTVTTNAASSVTTTGATLNGTVNAHDSSTTVTFEYGTTTAYGTTVTADPSPVTGSTDTAVSKAIAGLTPNTIYHYRVVATNSSGTSNGADMTFATSVGPPIVTTGSASPLITGAILHGTVNAQNASTTVTFEYGTTVAYGSTVTADQSPVTGSNDTAVTATLSGLSFNITYHYRVVGTNTNGTTNGADMTFKTTLNPSATTGEATNVLVTTATVNGTANANNALWNVRFDYGTTIAYGSTMAATPNQISGSTDTPVSAGLTGLTSNTTYHYRTTVYSGGFLYFGSDMTFTTAMGPTVTTNAAAAVGATTATLNGTINANNNSTSVTFEFGETTGYGRTIPAVQSPVTGSTNTPVSATPTDLLPLTTYHYRAVGTNSEGTVYGADMTFTTSGAPPTAATNAASGVSSSGATLNGTVNANNDSTTVTFEYGTTTAYGTTVTAGQSPVTGVANTAVSKAITGLTNNTTYHYRVVAQNSSGTTYGADMTFYTGAGAPAVTTEVASSITPDSATLNGTVNANNSSTTVTFEYGPDTGYGKTVTADQSPVTGSTDTPVSAAISGLLVNTIYHYRVVGQNGVSTIYGDDMTFATTQLFDYGDAPDPSYPTLLAHTGARHGLGSDVYLGVCVDVEDNGQPTAGADGDDTATGAFYGTGPCDDDEDGVTFTTPLYVGATADVDVTANAACYLSAWVDFNDDGNWADAGEAIFSGQALTAGVNSLSFSVPSGAAPGDTYARFRCTTDGVVAFAGEAPDGEVEDYRVTVETPQDFGDAPDPSYPTLLASTGASHVLGSDVYLGACVDAEGDAQPSVGADGDDTAQSPAYGTVPCDDDEDGVAFTTVLRVDKTAYMNVTANAACTLSAWIDFNADGDWADADEELFPGGQALAGGANGLSFLVPADVVEGDTYARFRCTTDGAVPTTGQASDGEVEDYQVTVQVAPLYPADLDGNGWVNTADLSILLSQWGDCDKCLADLDGNGQVNTADLSILISQWGECP